MSQLLEALNRRPVMGHAPCSDAVKDFVTELRAIVDAPKETPAIAFARGMLAALAVVAMFDEETIYREIVGTVGIKALNDALEGPEDHEWSGLKRYGYRLPRRLRGATSEPIR